MRSAVVSSAMLSIVARSMACRSLLSSGRFERAMEADAITRSNMRMRAANLAPARVSIGSRGRRGDPHQSPRYTLRLLDTGIDHERPSALANPNQPLDPGRVGSVSEM